MQNWVFNIVGLQRRSNFFQGQSGLVWKGYKLYDNTLLGENPITPKSKIFEYFVPMIPFKEGESKIRVCNFILFCSWYLRVKI